MLVLQLNCTAEGFYGIEIEKVTAPQALLSALLLCFVPCKSPLKWEYSSGGHEKRVQHFKISAQGFMVVLCPPSYPVSFFFSSSSSLNSRRKV